MNAPLDHEQIEHQAVVDDMAWRYRESLFEEIGRIARHAQYCQLYLEDGVDRMSTFHLNEMRKCMKSAIQVHNWLHAIAPTKSEGDE